MLAANPIGDMYVDIVKYLHQTGLVGVSWTWLPRLGTMA